ncbi:MAG: CpXC domain-containing protein [Caldilineaceae bacterium]|nr:CpXC domain-containing protein [Caldilineaceae bacterium]
MSGIILPGQDKRPAAQGNTGSGIELPKGFSRRREQTAEQEAAKPAPPATPETPAPPAAAAPAATPEAAAGRPPVDLLFPPTGAQIQCPNCRTPYVVPVFTIIDLGANPELKAPLLSGQINVASCPNCGMGGPLSAPLLVHEPEHQFLGVFVPPAQSNQASMQQQKAIGDLTQTLMRKLPTEARKGYMLQPKQYMDWQRFMEQIWEFEGVTPEMLRRQRNQGELLQRLVGLANDPKALGIALERSRELVDREFFALLDRFLIMTSNQGQQAGVAALMQLRNQLMETTEVGQQIKAQQDRVRAILSEFTTTTTREEVLDKVLSVWQAEEDEEFINSLLGALAPMIDYQFLLLVSQRLETTTDETTREHLEQFRQLALSLQEQKNAAQQQMAQQMQQILQEVLQAPDMAAKLREFADVIDESFLAMLAANIQAAQRNNSTAAARRLQQVYEQAMLMLREQMPEDVRLLNELIAAPDKATLAQLLKENRAKFTKEFIASMQEVEGQLREAGRKEIADRLKSLRSQIALL